MNYSARSYVPTIDGRYGAAQAVRQGIKDVSGIASQYANYRKQVAESKDATMKLLNTTREMAIERIKNELGKSPQEATAMANHYFSGLINPATGEANIQN